MSKNPTVRRLASLQEKARERSRAAGADAWAHRLNADTLAALLNKVEGRPARREATALVPDAPDERAVKGNRTKERLAKAAMIHPRLSVFRSSKSIYAQVIDDQHGVTLASASSLEGAAMATLSVREAAARVGRLVAERAIIMGVRNVVFDRGRYIYHGRVKDLGEAARKAGLNFTTGKGKSSGSSRD